MHFLTHSLQPKEVLNTGTKAVHFNLDKCFALRGRLFAMAGNDASSEEVNDEEIFMRSNNIRIWNIETGRLLQEIVTDKVPLNGNHDRQQVALPQPGAPMVLYQVDRTEQFVRGQLVNE